MYNNRAMSKLIINGGKQLKGDVVIAGSKNAALPLIAASILVQETTLHNVPRIRDVDAMLEIIKYLGGEFEWTDPHTLRIDTRKLRSMPLPDIARKLRASIIFAGPLLARFGEAELPYPGGDIIGARPLDTHINGFKALVFLFSSQKKLSLRCGRKNRLSLR